MHYIGLEKLSLWSSSFQSVLRIITCSPPAATMSRRPVNPTRRFGETGGAPLSGSLHQKARPSPLLIIGLILLVFFPLFFRLFNHNVCFFCMLLWLNILGPISSTLRPVRCYFLVFSCNYRPSFFFFQRGIF